MPAMYRPVLSTISFVCLACIGRGQTPCASGQSNYTIPKYSTEYEVVNHIYETRRRYDPNCNTWEKIKSWFRTDRCDTKYVLEKVTRRINQTKTVKHEITQCCPGYKNKTDVCTKGCDRGLYGENCDHNCSCSIHFFFCDSNGQCLCPAGLTGDNCSLECEDGTFGMNCSGKCMCNNNSSKCNFVDGSCDCSSPGWEGEMCDIECRNGTFGHNCNQTCMCNENQTCSHVDGLCTCKAGWKGSNCSEECEHYKFGVDCKEYCSCDSNNTESCDRKSGYCLCRPGYIDLNCNQECPFGLYGEGCNYNCSNHCNGTDYCDFINGSCICLGKQGTNCTDECEQGKYGPDCEWECNCNNTKSNGSCNAYTGSCHCYAGWEGRNCTTVCQNGKFGHNCNQSCTCNENQDCHHVDGSCTCKRGWKGVTCSQGAALRAQSSPDQKQHLTYGLAGAGGLLAVVVIVVVAVVHRRNKRNSLRDSLESSGKENRTYCKDGADFTETMCIEEKEIKGNSYEDTFIDADHTNNGEKTDTNPESSKKPLFKEHIDDSKDLVAKTDSQVIYDTAEETTTTTKESANAYNTFNDIRKLDKDQQKDHNSQDEEDYDTLVHGSSCKGSIKRVTDDIEDYSSFAIVKQSSIQEEGGEDLYNVLNEDSVKKKHKTAQINDSSYHHIDLKNKTIDGERIPCPVKGEPAMVKANKETIRPAKASFSTKQMSTVEADDQQNVQANVNEKSIKVTPSNKTPPAEINSGPKKTRVSVNQNELQSETLDNLVRDKKVTDIDEVEYEDVIYDECQSEQTQGETDVIPGNNDNSSTKNLDKNGPEMKQASHLPNFNKSSFETVSADCLKGKTLITKNDEHKTSVTGIDTMQDTVSASQRSVSAEVAYEEVPEDEEQQQTLYENVDEDEPGSDSDSGLSDKVDENEEFSEDDKRPMNRKLSRRKEDYEEFQL